MKYTAIVLLILGLQAVMGRTFDKPIKKCTPARKFEGKFKLTLKMGTQSRQIQVATGTGTAHADDTIGKAAVFEKVVANGQTSDVSVYMSNNITYVAIPDRDVCQKKPMNIPILPGKVPPGVTLNIKRGEVHGIRVQIWDFSLKSGSGPDRATVYMSEDKCIMQRVEMKLEISGHSMYVVEDFYDMKEGIKDARVFDLPKVCVKRSYYGNSHRFRRSTKLHIQHALARHEMRSQILA